MAKGKNRAVFGLVALVFVFFIILVIFAGYTLRSFQTEDMGFLTPSKHGGQIAVIEVEGIIMESKTTVELLNRALDAPEIKAIIVRINSPGGAVGPTQEIYEEIRRIDGAYKSEDSKKGKPVYASFGAVAASGGYYIGAAARKIYANAGTMTGSIGVIMQFFDLSKLYDWAKIDQQNIKSGRYKDIGSPYRGMTEEEKALLNDMVKGVHKQFVNDIQNLRMEKIKGDIWELAQGQIFSGEQAHKLGLVDEIGSLWTAGRKIHKELKLQGEFGLKYIKKREKFSFIDMFENLDKAISNVNWKSMGTQIPMLMFRP